MSSEAARVRLDVLASVGLLIGAILLWVVGLVVAIIADAAFPAGLILLGLIAAGVIGTIVLLVLRRRAAWLAGSTVGVVVLGWAIAVVASVLGV